MNIRPGTVYLVGAGPGDPDLITVRGLQLIRRADVVVHDRLIPHALLSRVRADVRLIDVGKTPDHPGITQFQINEILVEEARAGRCVVRLKGGDPFVFGRGYEEFAACRAAGIRCIVVPGVTSAIAAPAAAGIPVTHRGTSRSMAIVTARTAEEPGVPLNYSALAAMETLVVLMGRAHLREVAQSLIDAGRDPATPAACIERGTTLGQRVVRSPLAELADAADRAELLPPVVTVIGDVAALSDEVMAKQVESAPLAGKRILITRAESSSAALNFLLREEGASVIECPLIRIAYPRRQEALVAALTQAPPCDWIVLTSVHAVRALRRAFREAQRDARALAAYQIAAIGPATSRALRRLGLTADRVPTEHTAESLADLLGPEVRGQSVLLPRSDIALPELPRRLREAGAKVNEIVTYRTRPAEPPAAAIMALREGVDAVVFCSPSAVRRYRELDLTAGDATIACIGPTTAHAARDAGLNVALVAQPHTARGIVASLIDHFSTVGAHP